jgi:hypothetical protein
MIKLKEKLCILRLEIGIIIPKKFYMSLYI